jgi:tetratricopeptide (TPR) repeat protein
MAKETQAALKSLDKALALRPNFVEASLTKALLLAQVGRGEEGIKVARAVQTQSPKLAGGYLAEAEIHFANKKYPDAGRLFAKASQIAGQGQPLVRAYQAYTAAGQAAEGEKLLEQWLKAHADDQGIRHTLAQAQLNGKRLKEAADNYRILVRANPRDLLAYNNLAWLLGELKDPQALAASEQAYKLAPQNAAVLDTYAWQLNLAGQPARALPLLREALKNQSDNAEIRWHLAASMANSGNKREAIVELDRLLASQADFSQRAQAQSLLAQLKK